jgi:DNA-binding response OmpR family regulator
VSAPRILLVDTDARWLQSEQRHLASLGYTAVSSASEPDAEKQFAASEFDLVILDLMLDHLDGGLVLAHHFKKARRDVPILMVTDLTRETGMVFKLASPGEKRWIPADRILPKPIRLDRLAFEAELLLGEKSLGTSTSHSTDHDDMEI